jgi:hypothetical protein
MRPKGSKDKEKRKIKTFLSSIQERKIIEQYEKGYSSGKLAKLYSVSKSCVSLLFKKRGVKSRVNQKDVCGWTKISDPKKIKKNLCGIYCLYFVNKKDKNDIKLYVGSSANIKNRLKDHYSKLNNKNHNNKLVQTYFCDPGYDCCYAIMKLCDEKNIMQEERAYQYKYNRSCLLNSWLATNVDDLLPWLNKAITLKSYNQYDINNNGCWEIKNVDKEGYGVLKVVAFRDWGPGHVKCFYSHRVAYWEKYGEYPELIRHKCDNKRCRNPDHLAEGNHRDNALDKRGDFPERFTSKWKEFGGNVAKLSEYFGWKNNCRLGDGMVSSCVYEWEKKLNLRDRYPEILRNNTNRKLKNSGAKR